MNPFHDVRKVLFAAIGIIFLIAIVSFFYWIPSDNENRSIIQSVPVEYSGFILSKSTDSLTILSVPNVGLFPGAEIRKDEITFSFSNDVILKKEERKETSEYLDEVAKHKEKTTSTLAYLISDTPSPYKLESISTNQFNKEDFVRITAVVDAKRMLQMKQLVVLAPEHIPLIAETRKILFVTLLGTVADISITGDAFALDTSDARRVHCAIGPNTRYIRVEQKTREQIERDLVALEKLSQEDRAYSILQSPTREVLLSGLPKIKSRVRVEGYGDINAGVLIDKIIVEE